jgi:hypothetical protein
MTIYTKILTPPILRIITSEKADSLFAPILESFRKSSVTLRLAEDDVESLLREAGLSTGAFGSAALQSALEALLAE